MAGLSGSLVLLCGLAAAFRPQTTQRRSAHVAPAIHIDSTSIGADSIRTVEKQHVPQSDPGVSFRSKRVSIPRSVRNSVRAAINLKRSRERTRTATVIPREHSKTQLAKGDDKREVERTSPQTASVIVTTGDQAFSSPMDLSNTIEVYRDGARLDSYKDHSIPGIIEHAASTAHKSSIGKSSVQCASDVISTVNSLEGQNIHGHEDVGDVLVIDQGVDTKTEKDDKPADLDTWFGRLSDSTLENVENDHFRDLVEKIRIARTSRPEDRNPTENNGPGEPEAMTVLIPKRKIPRIEDPEALEATPERQLEIEMPPKQEEIPVEEDEGDIMKKKAADPRSERVQALLRAGSMVRLDPEELNDLLSPRGMQRNLYRQNPFVSYGAVIPLEGLMLDTTKIHLKVWNSIAKRYNLRNPKLADVHWAASASPYDYYAFEHSVHRIFGYAAVASFEKLRKMQREFVVSINHAISHAGRGEIALVPGGAEWVEKLIKTGVRVALVTKLPEKVAKRALDLVGLDVRALGTGGLVADVDQTEDSQLYLSASLRMLRPPKRCVVMTDRPGGSTNARLAGMHSIAIADQAMKSKHSRLDLRDSDVVTDSYRDLSPYDLKHVMAETVYDSD